MGEEKGQDMNENSKVEIKIPSPFNLDFDLEMQERFETKLGKKPWVPVCEGTSCKIYVGDRNAVLPGHEPIMFPVFVTVSLIDPHILKGRRATTEFIKSLVPEFLWRQGFWARWSMISNKKNKERIPMKIVDCRMDGGDRKRFNFFLIVYSNPPVLISHSGEVIVDSVRQKSQ